MASTSAKRFCGQGFRSTAGSRAGARLPRMPSPMAGPDAGCLDIVGALTRRELTAEALVEATLARIADMDDVLRAWVTVDEGGALAQARALDAAMASGRVIGPLHGVPVGVKDIIDVAGLPTTCGAAAFAHRHPDRDATLVARLRAAGAVIVGKTVATEFAYKDPAPTLNPWSADHTPGGSSSGSAAAVAARHIPVAIGTQTVGSILRPSAFCGVVGLKGEHGAVPLDGVMPLAPSLDHGGPITRSVADAALVQAVLSGRSVDVEPLRAPRLAMSRRAVRACRARFPGSPRRPGRSPRRCRRRGRRGRHARLVRNPSRRRSRDPRGRGGERPRGDVPRARRRVRAADRGARPRRSRSRRRRPSSKPGRCGRRSARRSSRCWMASTRCCRRSPRGPAPVRAVGTGDFALCAPWSTAGVPSIAIPTGLDDDGLPLAIQLTAGT